MILTRKSIGKASFTNIRRRHIVIIHLRNAVCADVGKELWVYRFNLRDANNLLLCCSFGLCHVR